MSVSRRSHSLFSRNFFHLHEIRVRPGLTLAAVTVLCTYGLGQQTPQTPPAEAPSESQEAVPVAPPAPVTVTIPAGTSIALVLTHPIQSRHIHRGDDIYAQIVSAVTVGNEVVVPPNTLVQGKVEKLGRNGSRGELYLQSMSLMFPDGYVASLNGPVRLESNEGYALKDPGNGRVAAFLALPMAGAGVGALTGHAAASSQGTTITSTLPQGCTGPPPGCLTSSVTGPPDKGKDTIIGAAVGGGVGFLASLVVLGTSHHFFLDIGAPVEMVLPRPLTLKEDEVAAAIEEIERTPAPEPPPAPPAAPPVARPPGSGPFSLSNDTGICFTPGTPAAPGMPASPPIAHPCP